MSDGSKKINTVIQCWAGKTLIVQWWHHQGHFPLTWQRTDELLAVDGEMFSMVNNSTFAAGPLLQVSIGFYCSWRPVSWADVHPSCRPSARTETSIIHAISASADRGITTREIKWFPGPLPESACLSVRPSSPLLSLKQSQTQMNPPERRGHDCIWTGDTKAAAGAGCCLIISVWSLRDSALSARVRNLGCSQSCMCSSDTATRLGGTLYNRNHFWALHLRVHVTMSVSGMCWHLKIEPARTAWPDKVKMRDSQEMAFLIPVFTISDPKLVKSTRNKCLSSIKGISMLQLTITNKHNGSLSL